MGHKVHPNGFRLGVYRNWEAKWFAPDKEFKPLLLEDVRLRRMLMTRLKNAGVARIESERSSSALTITLHTAKPGIVIGKGGTSVDQLRDELEKITGKRVRVTIQEIKKPELSAQLVAENVAAQLEKRIAFRRAIKQSLMKTMRAGAQGVKIRVKGRLGGSEMARVEWNREGRVPLPSLWRLRSPRAPRPRPRPPSRSAPAPRRRPPRPTVARNPSAPPARRPRLPERRPPYRKHRAPARQRRRNRDAASSPRQV